ncbi:DUF4762 domain-containing protein [Serratia fonticola]|jgi:hypothetical protein|nr:DUF4762 domain-containing protein [Serratia fonticola]NTZ13669.1 DUF4762 domain-containing protein [Serratia fonticola]
MLTVDLLYYYNLFALRRLYLVTLKLFSSKIVQVHFGNYYKDIFMKKLNASEVSNVIGGYVLGCVITYERQITGTGTSAVTVCRRVATCQGKFGDFLTREPADLARCGA